jgi:hypothetical protein
MKRTISSRIWDGTRSGKLSGALAGLALACLLAPAAFGLQRGNLNKNENGNGNANGNPNDKKYFKATISPASVGAGSTTSFTLTITPCDQSAITTDCTEETQGNNQIGSVDIGFPAAFSLSGTPTVSASGGQGWHVHTPGGPVQLRGDHTGNQKIGIGDSVTFTFSATAPNSSPCVESSHDWTAAAASAVANEDVTLFDWELVDAALTVEVTCGVRMPLSKLVNGQQARCTDDPGTPEDETDTPSGIRPCRYPDGLALLDFSDPRFEVNAYTTTADGLPGVTLFPPGLPFPQQGIPIPPTFITPGVPAGSFLTGCEAPDQTTQPYPYTLNSVIITVTHTDGTQTTLTPAIYFYQGHACFNTQIPATAELFEIAFNNAVVCTYTQGYYGNRGSRAGGKLYDNFGLVYPVSPAPPATPYWLQVGDRNPLGTLDDSTDGWSMLFTSADGVKGYLPAGGTPAALNNNYTNPLGTQPPGDVTGSGVFGGQVLTLQINVDLGNAAVFGGIGNYLVFTGNGQCGNGKTVSQVLDDANRALSGLGTPDECTIPQLNELATRFNESFDECVMNPDDPNPFAVPEPAQ